MRHESPRLAAGLLCGLVAPPLWALAIFVCGRLQPDFDHVGRYISELGERGSPTEGAMRWGGFVATGLLHLGFAAALLARAPRLAGLPALVALLVAINGLGRIGAGLFACDPGCVGTGETQRLHGLAATLAFVALIAATVLAAPAFRADRRLRALAPWSPLFGVAALGFLVAMRAGLAPGLFERLASASLSLWIFVVAALLLTGASAAGFSDRPGAPGS